ncbi:MAG TPA: GNAT family N-acetyltransferase [Streptosporangiaceae bacterium]
MVLVRQAEPADAAALAAIADAAYRGYVPAIGARPAPMTADYAAVIRDRQTWVAVEDDVIVGLIVLRQRPGHLLIENVAVHPAAQRRGIGTILLDRAERQAAIAGVAELRLYTHETMTANQAYYRRHGYRETHRAEDEGFARVFFSKPMAR